MISKGIKFITAALILFLISLFLTTFANADNSGSYRASRRGEITVHNNSNRDLYISIAGRNQGSVSAGSSDSFTVRYGEHRCEAEWDGGSIHKYIRITKSSPYADWYISKDDVQ